MGCDCIEFIQYHLILDMSFSKGIAFNIDLLVGYTNWVVLFVLYVIIYL